MPDNPTTIQMNFMDVLPESWRGSDGSVRVLQSVYQCLLFAPKDIGATYLTGAVDDVIYIVADLLSELKFHTAVNTVRMVDGQPRIEFHISEGATSKGTHIVFFTRCDDPSGVHEAQALSKIEAAAGLIGALEGHNATYAHVFTQFLELPDGQMSGAGPSVLNPASLPRPFQNGDRVNKTAYALDTLDAHLKARMLLALRWLDKAQRETDGLDGFLKSWFALETLAMPDDTDVRPVVEMLATIYGKGYQDARDHFAVGRIQGLRSGIVHKGIIRGIHQQLTKYVQALVVDVLLHMTGQPTERRAEEILRDPTFPHASWRP